MSSFLHENMMNLLILCEILHTKKPERGERMRQIYKTEDGVLSKLDDFEQDIWVSLVAPDMNEIVETAKQYGIDVDDMKAALDDEESSRVQLEDG